MFECSNAKLEYHFNTKLSQKQLYITTVKFHFLKNLDPTSIKYLNAQEKESAEKLIIAMFPKNISTNSASLATTTSNEKRTNEIDDFGLACGFKAEDETLSKNKAFTLKQELAFYLTSRQENTSDISTFWRSNSVKLPLLASLVRKYCIIQATSVPSESRFSIANYVSRKERASLSSRNLRFSMILREKPKFEKIILKK